MYSNNDAVPQAEARLVLLLRTGVLQSSCIQSLAELHGRDTPVLSLQTTCFAGQGSELHRGSVRQMNVGRTVFQLLETACCLAAR